MPFVRGRYHINPVLGEALEAARDAENALIELQQEQQGGAPDTEAQARQKEPIHRVEIEAAELVPAHSGRGGRGFVAHVQRQASSAQASADDHFGGEAQEPARSNPRSATSRNKCAAQTETHVFANHRDLVSFLHEELGNDASQESPAA